MGKSRTNFLLICAKRWWPQIFHSTNWRTKLFANFWTNIAEKQFRADKRCEIIWSLILNRFLVYSGNKIKNKIQKIDQIKKEFANSYFWFSVDETTDKQGRSIANLLIGKLDGIKWHPPRLISVKSLEKVDFASIARFVNESLGFFLFLGYFNNFYLETIVLNKEKGLLAVTDGAAYMKKSIRHLKVFKINKFC